MAVRLQKLVKGNYIMPVTMKQVLLALSTIEPDYTEMAQIGPEAFPHLEILIEAMDPLIASKAVCLASVIEGDQSVEILKKAAKSFHPEVRIAAAVGARNQAIPVAGELLMPLLSDEDSGVRKIALYAIPSSIPPLLLTKLEIMVTTDPEPFIRKLSEEVLRGQIQP